jgi:DNA-binding transcriptional ArsR family regulator
MDVSRPAVSQHLRVLKAAHLVTDRAEGTRRLYAVDKRGIDVLHGWLDGFSDETLGRVQSGGRVSSCQREENDRDKEKGEA